MATTGTPWIAGSISGFTSINKPDDPDTPDAEKPLRPKVYDTGEIIEAIRKLQELLDPKIFNALKQTILDHINDRDNPHEVSIDDIRGDFRTDLFTELLPGTVPESLPWLILIPETLKTFSHMTTRDTPLYVCSREGYLEQIPEDTPAIDHSTGRSMLASWGARTNRVPESQPLNNTQSGPINATMETPGSDDPLSPLQDIQYGRIVDTQTDSRHGYSFSITYDTEKDHVSSLFIFPHVTTGYLTVFMGDNESLQATIDIADRTHTALGNTKFHFHILASGWWRVGIQHLPEGQTSEELVILYHTDKEMLQYEGTGAPIFSVFGLQHTEGVGLSPHIPTENGPGSHGATSYFLESNDLPNGQEGMFVLNIYRSPILDNADITLGTIDIGPNIRLAQTTTKNTIAFFANTSDETSFASPHDNIENTYIAVSYSPSEIKYATSGQDIIVDPISLPAIEPLMPWVIEPIEGGIYNITTYPNKDSGHALKFLLQEDLDVSADDT